MGRESAPEADTAGSAREGSSRRGVLSGAGLVGLAGLAAACGGGSDDKAAPTDPPGAGQQPGSSAPAGGGTSGSANPGTGNALAKTSDIPVGGGMIFKDEKVVVTQPTAGKFKAFSAICQHEGCTVGSVSGGTINCPCHGSKYKVSDASVVAGPAKRALPVKEITVSGGEINLAGGG